MNLLDWVVRFGRQEEKYDQSSYEANGQGDRNDDDELPVEVRKVPVEFKGGKDQDWGEKENEDCVSFGLQADKEDDGLGNS